MDPKALKWLTLWKLQEGVHVPLAMLCNIPKEAFDYKEGLDPNSAYSKPFKVNFAATTDDGLIVLEREWDIVKCTWRVYEELNGQVSQRNKQEFATLEQAREELQRRAERLDENWEREDA